MFDYSSVVQAFETSWVRQCSLMSINLKKKCAKESGKRNKSQWTGKSVRKDKEEESIREDVVMGACSWCANLEVSCSRKLL